MTKLDHYIAKRSQNNPEFAKALEQENISLEIAVAVKQLRKDLNLSQRDLAERVAKPQSTIARIERGSMNVSTKVLSEIAQATGQHLSIQFIKEG